jgi:hypothetical protein
VSVTLHSNRGFMPLHFQHCPRFHCKVIALKSRTFVVKSRTKFPRKFVRGLNAKLPNCSFPAPAVSRLDPRETVLLAISSHERDRQHRSCARQQQLETQTPRRRSSLKSCERRAGQDSFCVSSDKSEQRSSLCLFKAL